MNAQNTKLKMELSSVAMNSLIQPKNVWRATVCRPLVFPTSSCQFTPEHQATLIWDGIYSAEAKS